MTSVLKNKRYLVLSLVPVFIVLVALSPLLLSSSSALHFFLAAVNKNISGTLSIESWLIGWQQGVLCQNVKYSDPEKGISASAPSMTSNRGLMELLLAPKNLGTVYVERPLVELSGPAVQAFFPHGKAALSEIAKNTRSSSDETPIWDQVFVKLQSRNGQVKTEWNEQDRNIAFKDISVDTSLAEGVATFAIAFYTMDQGFVQATGSLNLPAHKHGWLETIIAETQVKLSALPLRDFLQAGAAISILPQGDGVMNGDFQFKAVGLDHIELDGFVEFSDVTLNGGFLGDDHPSFRKIYLTVDHGRWTDYGCGVKGLELVSDTLNLKASGELSSGKVQLTTQGILNLPVLFDQFPRLLNVNESTFVDTGTFDFSVDLDSTRPNQSMKIKANASDIGGIFQDHQFFWDSPTTFLVSGEKKDADVRISALQLEAPFARAKGSGGLQSFSMDAVVDLDKAFMDIGTLFQLDLDGSGEMEMAMKSSPAEGESNRFKFDTDLTLSDFMLSRHNEEIVPLHDFSLTGFFKAPTTFFNKKEGELDLQVVLSSWIGEVFLVLNGDKSGDLPFKGYFTTDFELHLGNLSQLFQAFDVPDSDTGMAGTMQMQADGFVSESSLEIRDMSAEIADFLLEGNGTVFNDPDIRLRIMQPVNQDVPFLSVRGLQVASNRETYFHNGTGLNLIDFGARDILLHNIQLEAGSATTSIKSLVVPDWRKPLSGLRAQFSLSADLGKMSTGLQAIGLLQGDTAFSGATQATFLLSGEEESMQEMNMHVQVAGFGLNRRNEKLIDSEKVVFSSRLQGQIPFGEMSVEELQLRSDILNVDATGKVSRDGAIPMLELNGSMKPDMDKFASIIAQEFDIGLKMTGRPEEQFILKYPLWGLPGEGVGQLAISSSLHADSLVFNNIGLREVALPFHFDNSNLHMELFGRINEGRLELVTDTDFVADPAVIKVNGNRQIMTGVKLDDSLVTKVFSRIHPLLGVLVKVAGPIDVRLDSLWWPIGEKGRNEANFVAILDAREIQIQSSALLKKILTIFGLEKQRLQLRDNEIYCIGRNGRIKCSPVRVLAGNSEIIMDGSVSLDGSLDFQVEVPITRKLVSDKGFQALGGTIVKVAVKGTVENPSFDKAAVISTVHNLIKQAENETVKKNNRTKTTAETDG